MNSSCLWRVAGGGCYFVFFLAFALLVSACSVSTQPSEDAAKGVRETDEIVAPRREEPRKNVKVPPWQVWADDSLGDSLLARADGFARVCAFEDALLAYREAEQQSGSAAVREEAFVRRIGTMLKLGRSRAVLQEVSRVLSVRGQSIADVKPRMGVTVAYAYRHEGDVDQALAWFGDVYRKSLNMEGFSLAARREISRMVREMPEAEFENFQQRWAMDSVIAPLFARERLRRARGGKPEKIPMPDWFSASTYMEQPAERVVLEPPVQPTPAIVGTVPLAAASNGAMALGVLLPMSGTYAQHAERVKRGIELALEDPLSRGEVKLVLADTEGNPETALAAYEQLVVQDGANVILGPLLVNTSERIVEKSRQLGVPFVTFTKKKGIPAMDRTVFRLGATAENQIDELLSYAVRNLKLNRIAVLYPQNASGEEFLGAFVTAARRFGANIAVQLSYVSADADSVRRAVERLSEAQPQAVFIPDSLEGALPVFEALARSPLKGLVLLGPAYWNDPVALRGYGVLLDGAVFVTPFFGASRNTQTRAFVDRYRAKYGEDPELLAAQAFDAAQMVIEGGALSAPDREQAIRRLEAVGEVNGVTGKLSVDRDGEISRRMYVLRISQGEVEEVLFGGEAMTILPADGQ